MSSVFLYFKYRWPEKSVPNGEPAWMHYEVIEATDVVTRTVDVYPTGHAIRNSVELAGREGIDQRSPEHRSLVHGPFLGSSEEELIPTNDDEFEALWEHTQDKPWPPECRNSG
ncbi:hypothetical protein LP7551_04034 [Roseibium album]|nr:hypothetical protein LP7551_04034 [Roseibium album]